MNAKSLITLGILAILHAGCGDPTDTDASSGNESANISGSEDSDEETLGTDHTSSDEPADCAPLDRYQCLATDGCRSISGHRVLVDELGFCAPAELFVRCAENIACADAIGYALSPDGEWWMFPDLCTPDGWPVEYSNPEPEVECEPMPIVPADCASVPVEDCHKTVGCAVANGLRINEADGCFFEKAIVSCEQEAACGGSVFARDPDGDLWVFGSDSCSPAGWPIEEPVTVTGPCG